MLLKASSDTLFIKVYLYDSDLINVLEQEIIELLESEIVLGVNFTLRAGGARGRPPLLSLGRGRVLPHEDWLPDLSSQFM